MTTWNPRANEIFLEALELSPAGERREFLDRACGDDAALRAEVDAFLEASDNAGSFLEVSRRHGDYAMVGVAARTSLDGDGRLGPSRLVFLSVGDAPVEVVAGRQTAGEKPSEELFAAIAAAAAGELEPASDIHASAEYRRHLAAVLARRALATAAARAAGERPA